MSDKTIISMSEKLNDASMRSPKQALEDSIKNIEQGRGAFEKSKKALIITLDDTDGQYAISFEQAGMKMSECIGLCEITKQLFLEEMGY